MKKWLPLLFVVTVMFFLSAGMANAEKATVTPKLILDGKLLQPIVAPTIMNNYVMVPVRIVTESLGYTVDFKNDIKQVTVSDGAKQIVMTVNQSTAYVDGQAKQLDMPPVLQSDSVLIPLRFMSESVGTQVYWDGPTKSVFLYSSKSSNTSTGPKDVEIAPPTSTNESNPEEVVTGSPDNETPGPDSQATNPDTVNTVPTAGKLFEIGYDEEQVTIKYSGTIAPKVMTLSNPERIVVDFPDADFAPSFYPPLPSDPNVARLGEFEVTGHPALTKVRYSVFSNSPRTIRVVLDMNQPWSYEFKQDSIVGDFIISLKQSKPDKSLYTVVLDAGHGGSDPGAKSLSKRWEKEFNLSIVLKVQKLLASEERIHLVLTRSDDSFPSLSDRSSLANGLNADLFVSVHANSNTKSSINGTETYYTRDDSLAFASTMHAALVQATQLKDGGVRIKNLHVTRETTMPAALLEIGYLSNSTDEAVLWDEAFQDRVAKAIVQGIKNYLNLN